MGKVAEGLFGFYLISLVLQGGGAGYLVVLQAWARENPQWSGVLCSSRSPGSQVKAMPGLQDRAGDDGAMLYCFSSWRHRRENLELRDIFR